MGHIKEPEGIDLVINSRILTVEEEYSISNYILKYKAKHLSKKTPSKRAKEITRKKVGDPSLKK